MDQKGTPIFHKTQKLVGDGSGGTLGVFFGLILLQLK
jgi:hypothetical protein